MDLTPIANLVQIIGGIIVIVGATYGLYQFSRRMQRERLRAGEGRFFPLPQDPRFESFFEKIREQLDRGESKKVVQEIEEKKHNPIGLDPVAPITSLEQLETQDPLALAELLLAQAEALLKLGDRKVLFVCQEIIQLCKVAKVATPSEIQRKEHILGRAFNNIAYFYRTFKDYPRAEQEFRKSIPHLRRSNDRVLYADTLKNLAFVYALQGKLTAAELLCQDAIEIFHERGVKSGKAYGLNTLGFIQVERRQHQIGLLRCKRAHELFESIHDLRGIGLACIFWAYSLQRLSGRDVYSVEERIRYLEQAENYLNRSTNIFLKQYEEPPRLVEAHGALGCVYRDWARIAKLKSAQPAEIEKLEDAALDKLQRSFDGARNLGMTAEQVDVLEDMAQVYFERKEYKKTQQVLDEATTLVPPAYLIANTGLPALHEAVTPYWASLGKIALLRGHVEYDLGHESNSAYWYTLAGAYLDLFAHTTPLTDYAASSIYARLRNSQATKIALWRHQADKIQEEYQLRRTQLMDILDQTLGVLDLPSETTESARGEKEPSTMA